MLLTSGTSHSWAHAGWAVLSCDTIKYSPRALNRGGTFQIFALNRTVHTAMQIPQRNQRNSSLHIPNLGAIVCNDTSQAHGSKPHHFLDRSPSEPQYFTICMVWPPLLPRGFYFWHLKCWICCLAFKNPNQNVRTCGQSRTTAQGLQQGCQEHAGGLGAECLTKPSRWLGSFTASDQKKRRENKTCKPLLTVFR